LRRQGRFRTFGVETGQVRSSAYNSLSASPRNSSDEHNSQAPRRGELRGMTRANVIFVDKARLKDKK
jgi:hypothetical protein